MQPTKWQQDSRHPAHPAQTPPAPPAARAGSGRPARLQLGAVTAQNCQHPARNSTSGPHSPHQNGDAEQTQSPGAERLEVTNPRTSHPQPTATTKAPGPCAGWVKQPPAPRCDRHPSALCTGLLPAAPFLLPPPPATQTALGSGDRDMVRGDKGELGSQASLRGRCPAGVVLPTPSPGVTAVRGNLAMISDTGRAGVCPRSLENKQTGRKSPRWGKGNEPESLC